MTPDTDDSETEYYSGSVWLTGNQVEAKIPKPLRERLDLYKGQHVTITPDLENFVYVFRVSTDADPNHANVRRLKLNDRNDSMDLRFNPVLASATGLLDAANQWDELRFEYEADPDDGSFIARPSEPLRPDVPVDAGQLLDLPSMTKQLFELDTEFGVELDDRFIERLGIKTRDPVAWSLSVRDGDLVLVADFDVTDDSAPNVRRVQTHQSGVEGHLKDQYRLYVPKALVHALALNDQKLQFDAERDRIVVSLVG